MGVNPSQPVPRAVVPHGEPVAPARPGVRHVRVPRLGIVVADDDLRHRVDRIFHWPMIVLALLTLPLLVIDYMFIHEASTHPGFVPRHDWLWWLTISGLTIIWLAFFVEFIVKIAIAESRTEYLKRNWLDVIIIVIPVLRPLRAAAVARTTRVFTLRGVGFKFARYVFTIVVGFEATERFLERLGLKKRSTTHPDPEGMTRHELIAEVRRRRALCEDWETWYEAEQKHCAQQGITCYSQSRPSQSPVAGATATEAVTGEDGQS